MRDIALMIIMVFAVGWTLRYPFVGILSWTWITLMVPHQQAYGFSRSFQINLVIAIGTLASWFLNQKERKLPPLDATFWLTLSFFAWMTLNSFQAIDGDQSWPIWDRTWRQMLLGVMIAITATERVRIHALILVIVLSLMNYGVKGGAFTIMTGGTNHVMGPADSMIGDNNQLALAILMSIPLAYYLFLYSTHPIIRRVFLAGMALSMVAVLGSYSRGAFVALAGLACVAWFRARHKWLYPIIAAVVIVPALTLMPSSYFTRINTIQDAGSDASFQGRVDAWYVAFGYARDHFPFGAGFSCPQLPEVFNYYMPGKDTHAAHSIFFEVLGDNGFVGFFIYMALLIVCVRNTLVVRKLTKGRPELGWAYELTGMIQLTLFVFFLGGSALSFAYYDLVFILTGLMSAMKEYVLRNTEAQGWRKGGIVAQRTEPEDIPGGLLAEH